MTVWKRRALVVITSVAVAVFHIPTAQSRKCDSGSWILDKKAVLLESEPTASETDMTGDTAGEPWSAVAARMAEEAKWPETVSFTGDSLNGGEDVHLRLDEVSSAHARQQPTATP